MFVITIFVLILVSSMRATHVMYYPVDTVISSLEQGLLSCASFSEHAILIYGLSSARSLFDTCLRSYIKYLNSLYNSKIGLLSTYVKVDFKESWSNITYCASFIMYRIFGISTGSPIVIRLCEYYSAQYTLFSNIIAVADYVKRCIIFSSTHICYRTVNIPMYVASMLNVIVENVTNVVPCYTGLTTAEEYRIACMYVRSGLGYAVELPFSTPTVVVVFRHGRAVFLIIPVNLTNTATGLYALLW